MGDRTVVGDEFAIRSGRWKYIEAPAEERRELFDLRADPDERNDRIAENGALADRLSARIAEWRADHETAPRPAAPLSDGDRRRLEAMGYLE